MQRSAALGALFILMVLSLSILASCRDDVFVEPPASLVGRYVGTYSLMEVANGIDTIDFRAQFVDFVFTSNAYRLRWDASSPMAPPIDTASSNIRYFCDSDGDYDLVSGVQFTVIDSSVGVVVCTQGDNPDGPFQLDQSRGDTVLIIQVGVNDNQNSVTKTLRLVLSDN